MRAMPENEIPPAECTCQVKVDTEKEQLSEARFGTVLDRASVIQSSGEPGGGSMSPRKSHKAIIRDICMLEVGMKHLFWRNSIIDMKALCEMRC